jgi:nitroreductase
MSFELDQKERTMNVFDAIRTKRAIRNYQDKPIPDEIVRSILDAGRLSQSAKNLQPWHFVAIRNREILKKLAELGRFSPHLGEAPLGIVILMPDPAERFQILFDAGQAAAYMQLAAWEMGVGSCLVTSYDRDRVRELLGFPDNLHIRIAIAFGYPAENTSNRRPRKGGRRTFDDVVHWEKW